MGAAHPRETSSDLALIDRDIEALAAGAASWATRNLYDRIALLTRTHAAIAGAAGQSKLARVAKSKRKTKKK